MEYNEFINKLYIKGTWQLNVDGSLNKVTKDEFTKQLFLSSVNNDSTITDKRHSSTAFKGYNRGNSIAEIAYDILGDLNEEGIIFFLKDTFNSNPDEKDENVQKICNKFKDDIPDISPDNIYQKISDYFIYDILKPASKKSEKIDNISGNASTELELHTITNASDSYTTSCWSYINISNRDIEKLQKLILDLSVSIDNLTELGAEISYKEHELRIFYKKDLAKYYTDYDNYYTHYQVLIKEFNFYCRKYPVEPFESAFSLALKINKNSFKRYPTRDMDILYSGIYDVWDFKNAIIELSSELDNYIK